MKIWTPKIIDRYIMKKFIMTLFVSLILIIGIVIIFDISEKIDNFVSNQVPLKSIIFDYYVNFIPYFMNMFSPLFVFITVIFFTSRLAADSEIIAILSGGISFHRMMVPYILSAAIISLVSLGLNLFIIPRANEIRIAFEEKNVRDHSFKMRDVHYQIAPGQFVYVESFSKWNNTAYRFTLESVEDSRVVSKISAESAVWDSTAGCWHLRNYFHRHYGAGLKDKVEYGEQIDTVCALTVTDFYQNEGTVETLSFAELNELVETQRMRGDSNIIFAQMERQRRFAMPFSAFVLTIIGVSLSSRKKRGGIGINIGIGIALAFSYILFMRFSEMFVYTNTLPPIIALWLPNLLYSGIAAVLYRLAPK